MHTHIHPVDILLDIYLWRDKYHALLLLTFADLNPPHHYRQTNKHSNKQTGFNNRKHHHTKQTNKNQVSITVSWLTFLSG